MNCANCNTPNPAQAHYCMGCGTLLVNGVVCTTCQTLLPVNANYCYNCGNMVIQRAGGLVLPSQPAQPAQLTQMPVPAHVQATLAQTGILATTEMEERHQPSPLAVATPTLVARPVNTMLESLREYLPDNLYEPLERRPNQQQMVQVRDHLTALLQVARTYLPRPVVEAPQPPGEPRGGMFQGTFLFGDVSGFTPLSERLAQFGQLGAEMITDVINDLFHDMVTILFDHGGTLLKFGGDALLGLFPAETDEEMVDGALRAVQTALAMQVGMEKFAAIEVGDETQALRIKCGISSGRYFAAHIGTPNSMAYVTTGHTVNRADQAEGNASPGDIVISQTTHDLLGDGVSLEEVAEGFYRIIDAPRLADKVDKYVMDEPPEGDVDAQITYLVDRLDWLSPYLPHELISRIVNNPADVKISPEHRPVSVMFVNYVGISDLIEDMGDSNPDFITHHLNNYFVEMAEVVERYEGTIARMDQYSVGDRLVIFFGAPRAHEDDPMRAVYTALDMQAATREHFSALQTPEGIYRFRQRIGLNVGRLFAGNAGATNLRQEYTLMGDDINMAARLMSKAGWGEIFISKKTRDFVAPMFELEDKGELKVKGKEILIPTYTVLGRKEQVGGPDDLGTEVPLIGRDDTLESLQQCGHALFNNQYGQIITIVGDGGIGKSRLARVFKSWVNEQDEAENVLWLNAQALSFSEKVSYWMAVQVIRGVLELPNDASADDVLFTLWECGEALMGKETAREAIPFLAHIMGLELEGEWAAWVRELDPEVRQKQTFWAAREFFTATARQRPTIIALDDVHWADEASLALFEDLYEITVQAPLMIVLIFRKMRDKGCWQLRNRAANDFPRRHTELELLPLLPDESQELLKTVLPGAEFSDDAHQDVLDKAAGNPFYLEEVVRVMIDSRAVVEDENGQWKVTEEIHNLAVPATLEGAIVARLDRLNEDTRQALQTAAVIGRTFELNILSRVIQEESELSTWLAQMERGDLVHPLEFDKRSTYNFMDALVQEVAYENMLVQRRQQLHRNIGEALEQLLGDRVDNEDDDLALDLDGDGIPEKGTELLAFHFHLSDDRERAIKYLDRAGRKAQREYANQTAIDYYNSLIQLVGGDEGQSGLHFDVLFRRQRIHGVLGRNEDRKADLDALMQLVEAHPDDARRSDVMLQLADFYAKTSRYDDAEVTCRQALEIKEYLNEEKGQANALYQLGVLAYYRGDYDKADPLLNRAIELQHAVGDLEGEAWSVMFVGMINFVEGRYSDAEVYHERAYDLANSRHDTFQIGIHLTNSARVLFRLGRYEEAQEKFEVSLEMKTRVGDKMGQGFNLHGLGMTYVYRENYEDADAALQKALRLRQELGDERGASYSLYGLGQVALHQQDYQTALEKFTESYKLRSRLGLKGENIEDLSALSQAFLGLGKMDEALKASAKAIEMFREQKDMPGEEQEVLFNHFRVLAAFENAEAEQYLQETYDMMMHQAERISNPEDRQTFLMHMKINQEIMQMVQSGAWNIQIRDGIIP